MVGRRNFILGLGAALAAPAIIRTPGLLMPVSSIKLTNLEIANTALDRLAQLRAIEDKLLDEVVFGPGFMDKAMAMRAHNWSVDRLRVVIAEIDSITGIDRMRALHTQMQPTSSIKFRA
jgi:hypothetical protein